MKKKQKRKWIGAIWSAFVDDVVADAARSARAEFGAYSRAAIDETKQLRREVKELTGRVDHAERIAVDAAKEAEAARAEATSAMRVNANIHENVARSHKEPFGTGSGRY